MSDDYRAGYEAGWDANNRYRRDRHDLMLAESSPSGSLMPGVILGIFGVLFLFANIVQWARFHNADIFLWLCAIGSLTISFFSLRGRPEAKRKAEEARAAFEAKWG